MGKVEGTVTYKGKPIENGAIIFEVPGNRSAYGKIQDGQIVDVTTSEFGDGVPVGEAKVAINASEPASQSAANPSMSANAPGGPSGMDLGKSLLPKHYANPATSDLTVTIEQGENTVTFDLD
ncbi:hypothetical protein [Blastopirellula marina]|uniref:Uncharacterized protein n=1 Tax=Blastopirellula marina TaxID=124 RepID=A0A2S8GDL9_9BACT|nr:hypothetical protein [Blastopirellula marina]PQO42557.1 hypothetical protein C5Y98_01585 [Blastopirellula marina]PTL46323.1 hypothetical protein C5Y97_01585 [Blastopirellula marina]